MNVPRYTDLGLDSCAMLVPGTPDTSIIKLLHQHDYVKVGSTLRRVGDTAWVLKLQLRTLTLVRLKEKVGQ